MGGNSYDTYGEGSASTYWRRRFIILAIGLLIFGLAAWGLSSALAVKPEPASRAGSSGQPAGASPKSDTSHHARSGSSHSGNSGAGRSGAGGSDGGRSRSQGQSAGGRSGSGQAAGGEGRQAGRGRRVGSGSASQPGAGTSSSGRTGSGQAAGHGTILPAFCGSRDIVVSVFAGQTQFGPKDSPTFELSIVSTQPAECTFNIGSAHLVLVIKEGPATIWSSADCPTGTASLDAALARGVPTVVTVTWNRKTSAPGCSTRTTQVPPGTYTAYAKDAAQTSQPVTFRLN